ncbi:MAG TPA: hypothetical protein VFO36_12100 [Nitrospiraceae bacterium]|nr:hypothetical protein [Nitrospiraceae bacterium]
MALVALVLGRCVAIVCAHRPVRPLLFIGRDLRVIKATRLAMTLYAIAIMIGSVHLGWHYAIDGYAGAIGSILIWWMVGLCLRRWSYESGRFGTATRALL